MDVLRDRLTGLANLIGLVDELRVLPPARLLAAADFDDFAAINERYGHTVGDRMLQIMADCLRDLGRSCPDGCYPYRLGGDEFIINIPGGDPAVETAYLTELRKAFKQRLAAEHLPEVGLHIGTARYPAEGDEPAVLLARLELKVAHGLAGGPARDSTQRIEGLVGWFISRLTETVDALRATRQMAMTDPISGMPNHRAAEEFIDRILTEHNASANAFSVLFIDGDNLKAYNELLGYEQGNEMLRSLGATIASRLRTTDHVSRWLSGDEFLVIMPNAGSEIAASAAERIRAAVAEESLGWAMPVTVSIGIATCPADGCRVTELLAAAADANQAAKQLGKNRVVQAPGLAAHPAEGQATS